MQITPAVLAAIYNNFNVRYQAAYQQTPVLWDKFADLYPSETAQETYAWMGMMPKLRKWLGERFINNLQGRGYVLINDKYEDTFGVKREQIEDDKVGVFAQALNVLGREAKIWPDDLTTAALVAGTTALSYDGQAYFSSSHPIDIDNASSSTYQNNFYSGDGKAGVSMPLNAVNYGTVRAAMMSYQAEDGRSLNIIPDLLMVPPALEAHARIILHADLISQANGGNAAQASTNIWKGSANLVVNPYLTSATTWYMLCTSRGIKPIVFQQRNAPEFTFMNQPADPNVFLRDEYLFGVRARGAAGYSLPFLAARADGT